MVTDSELALLLTGLDEGAEADAVEDASKVSNSCGRTYKREFVKIQNRSIRAYFGSCVNTGDKPRSLAIVVIVLEQQLPCLLIQGGLWIRVDQKTFDGHQDVPNAIRGLPIFLQCVDANLSSCRDVRVEDFGCESA